MLDHGGGSVSARLSNKILTGSVTMPLSGMRMYLSDFEDPKRLLQFDNLAAGQLDNARGVFQVGNGETNVLDSEPCGELVITPVKVAPGRDSEFLPECYKSLFEEGNILIT